MRRGEICWADLPDPIGSGPSYRRPVLIIQSNTVSQSSIQTVIILILTSNLDLSKSPGNVLIPRSVSKLTMDSVVNVSQIFTIDKDLLVKIVSVLPGDIMSHINAGLRRTLAL